MLPATQPRVPRHTASEVNQVIEKQTEQRLSRYADARVSPDDLRIEELEREWDIERVLQLNASAILLGGLALGTIAHKAFYALPVAVGGFLLQHALQGWCPPVPLFRRFGVRTPREIEQERQAVKFLRGDYLGQNAQNPPRELLKAAS